VTPSPRRATAEIGGGEPERDARTPRHFRDGSVNFGAVHASLVGGRYRDGG
jgi:hypothetical protein